MQAFSPDGRLLAADDGGARVGRYGGPWFGSSLTFWDVRTGEKQSQLSAHQAPIHCIAFAPDGKTLATGSADHSILVWKTPARKAEGPAGNATPKQLLGWWTHLGGADAAAAHQAGGKLLLHPKQAVRLIRDHVKPMVAADPKQVRAWIADLDSETFETRENACSRLEALGELVEPDLRRALEGGPPLGVRKRLESLLESTTDLSPRHVLTVRALTLLEQIGSPEARRVLDGLARGAPAARITAEAKVRLQRLASR